jgi:hypothetical protein
LSIATPNDTPATESRVPLADRRNQTIPEFAARDT